MHENINGRPAILHQNPAARRDDVTHHAALNGTHNGATKPAPNGLSTQESAHRPAPIRLGVVGFGIIGRKHFQALRGDSSFEVTAVSDVNFNDDNHELQNIARESDWRALVENDELDALSLCVPHHLHAPMATAALQAGKHLMVEKPLALNCAQGHEMARLARTCNRVLMVEMTHRFYPPMVEARELVKSGALGEIYAVQDRIIEPVNGQLTPWMQQRAQAGGGVALTSGIHMLDRIAFLTGQSLRFDSGQIGYGAGHGDVEDLAMMNLHFAESGVPVQLLAAWPNGTIPQAIDDELTLYGTRATLRVWAWRGWRLEPLDGGAPQHKECYAPQDDLAARVCCGIRGAFAEFAAAIHDARPPRPTADEVLRAQELVEEFYEKCAVKK